MVMEMFVGSSTGHATYQSEEMTEALEVLSKRPDLYDLLIKIYYHDYFASPFFEIYPTFQCWFDHNEELKIQNIFKR